jgi:minor histocompatibility antigen H13
MDPILITYTAIVTMALVPIYIGSQLSIVHKGISLKKNSKNVFEYTQEENEVESMTSSDAWKFPLIGSAVLFGLYILFKFSKEYINLILSYYFLLFGVLAVAATVRPIFSKLMGVPFKNKNKPIKLPLFWTKEPLELDSVDIVDHIVGLVIGSWYWYTKHWIANNILGLCFSIEGIALLSLGSYKVGCILLGGLFFYDIFWVFGTDVMVSVAKAFDAPVKLLFPKSFADEVLQFSMLGLGDIVIPGVFLAFLLRFDVFRAANQSTFSPTYFKFTFFAYFLGLVTTIFVMHVFKAAQPALLYLVPYCVLGSFGLAMFRGEIKELLHYSEEKEEKPKAE